MSTAWMRRLARAVNNVSAASELNWLKALKGHLSTLKLPGRIMLEPILVHGRPRVTLHSRWLEYNRKESSCELGDVLWIYECCDRTAPVCRAAVWQVKFRNNRNKFEIDATQMELMRSVVPFSLGRSSRKYQLYGSFLLGWFCYAQQPTQFNSAVATVAFARGWPSPCFATGALAG